MLSKKQLHTFAVSKLKMRFIKKPFPCYFDKTNEKVTEEELQVIYSEYIKINPELKVN